MSKLTKLITKSECYEIGSCFGDLGIVEEIKGKVNKHTSATYYEIYCEKGMVRDYYPMQIIFKKIKEND